MAVARLWYNNAEGGTNGATPTTSDTGSGHAHSALSIGAGNTAVYSTTAPILGTKSIVLTSASANQLILGVASGTAQSPEWTTAQPEFYVEFFFKASAAPGVTTTILRGYSDTGYATQILSISYTTTRRLTISNTVGGQSVSTPSGAEALVSGQSYLIRFSSNATAGTMEVYVYEVGNVSVYTQATLTGLSQASVGSIRYGLTTGSANFTATTEMRLSKEGYLSRLDVVNTPPSVSLGANVIDVEPYADIPLAAFGTDAEGSGTIVSYNIYQKTGPAVTITGTGSFRSYYSPGLVGGTTLTFGATCTDNQGAVSAEHVVSHTILPVDRAVYVGGVLQPYYQQNA